MMMLGPPINMDMNDLPEPSGIAAVILKPFARDFSSPLRKSIGDLPTASWISGLRFVISSPNMLDTTGEYNVR